MKAKGESCVSTTLYASAVAVSHAYKRYLASMSLQMNKHTDPL